jgi:hypothetical protein
MGAVAVMIDSIVGRAEVLLGVDLAGQIRMRRVDTRVEDRHGDTLAGVAPSPRVVRADLRQIGVQRRRLHQDHRSRRSRRDGRDPGGRPGRRRRRRPAEAHPPVQPHPRHARTTGPLPRVTPRRQLADQTLGRPRVGLGHLHRHRTNAGQRPLPRTRHTSSHIGATGPLDDQRHIRPSVVVIALPHQTRHVEQLTIQRPVQQRGHIQRDHKQITARLTVRPERTLVLRHPGRHPTLTIRPHLDDLTAHQRHRPPATRRQHTRRTRPIGHTTRPDLGLTRNARRTRRPAGRTRRTHRHTQRSKQTRHPHRQPPVTPRPAPARTPHRP